MVSEEFKKEFSETFNKLWLVFFAHHTPDKFHRCLRIQIRGRRLYLCARCTGMLSGIYVAIFFLPLLQSPISPTIGWILLIVFPLPAMADWLSQYGSSRESNNKTRIVSGILLGLSIGSLSHFREYLLALTVALIYVLLIVVVVLIIRSKRGGDTHECR